MRVWISAVGRRRRERSRDDDVATSRARAHSATPVDGAARSASVRRTRVVGARPRRRWRAPRRVVARRALRRARRRLGDGDARDATRGDDATRGRANGARARRRARVSTRARRARVAVAATRARGRRRREARRAGTGRARRRRATTATTRTRDAARRGRGEGRAEARTRAMDDCRRSREGRTRRWRRRSSRSVFPRC